VLTDPLPERARRVVAASRGNHRLGLAWAGRRLGAPVTVCVPRGNNPEENAARNFIALRRTLAGKKVGVVLSGANIDQDTPRRSLNREW